MATAQVRSSSRPRAIAALLFCSGTCALVYQIVWMRELRHVFGASTPASAAVLAVFMGGLGYGSHLLGRRADTVERPLGMYAVLEAGIAVTAALTPFLLAGARAIYQAVGGSLALGLGFGTVVRLLLSAVVLLPPTLLMGGTLPAAARAATHETDVGRVQTALLYGTNTLGAVTGAALATFALLEAFGTRWTLYLAAITNLIVAASARMLDRRWAARGPAPGDGAVSEVEAAAEPAASTKGAPTAFVLAAAALVGFVFLVMELVWYRMLSPLLGGSSYTFGLILAVALFGIGAGGLGYTFRSADRPARLRTFAASCGLEALAVGVPLALGDRVALLALYLRPFGSEGLFGHIVGWTVVTAVVVLPASVIAGYQFPLLIALLGRARRGVGRDVGAAYAFNTLGAIAGSLAGGFLLIPGLGCIGTWKLAVWVLGIVCAAAAVLELRARVPLAKIAPSLALWLAAVTAVHTALGPTAVWRHSPIGAGRADEWLHDATRNSLKYQVQERRRSITWETDGRESTIGLYTLNDTSFMVNGKSDGAAVLDAGTQVMSGLLSAMLHPGPVKRALVIGLGTGSTAGWLGALPDIERVDVVELEPGILHVAEVCSPVNHDVLDNPKVHVIIGDGREVLLTSKERYDLIFSEPSNPYRAGVASLFTREFYEAVRERLQPDGIFAQWVQAYETDSSSIRSVYATLGAVFPSVESWRTKYSDLLLVGRAEDRPLDVELLRRRVEERPFSEALMKVWRVDDAEGVLARFVARPSLARAIAEAEGAEGINTDDRNMLEFAFARTLGRPAEATIEAILETARDRGEHRPVLTAGSEVDWARVADAAIAQLVSEGSRPAAPPHVTLTSDQQARLRALGAWWDEHYATAERAWESQDEPARNAVEIMAVGELYAARGDEEKARPLIERLERWVPIEADALRARLHYQQGRWAEAFDALERALLGYRSDPWPTARLMARTYPLLYELVSRDRAFRQRASALVERDFAVNALRYLRLDLRLDLALLVRDGPACTRALEEFEPHRPWTEHFLDRRVDCLMLAGDPRAFAAQEELAEFERDEGPSFDEGLPPRDEPEAAGDSPSEPASAEASSAADVTAAAPSASP